jgi:hypothetical protein
VNSADRLSQWLKDYFSFLINSINDLTKTAAMKKIFFLLLIYPALTYSQINRSATELAKENIQEYLTGKLFKNCSYQPVSYGEITACKGNNVDIAWSVRHEFAISKTVLHQDEKVPEHKFYKFIFYLNDKMKVLRAESYD